MTMTTRLTLFTAELVQDSALSVSGLDRESSADQPFALINGVPTLVGRGLKGAAVAMARRFFDPLPRAVSDDVEHGALRRSAWEFSDTVTVATVPRSRAGVGIRHKTGARADGVLYDSEVIPTGTKWQLSFRVDWSQVTNEDEGHEAEGILGYVLAQHWMQGRCWLGGGVSRGLGWCHLEELKVWRLDEDSYEEWVTSGRTSLPAELTSVPIVKPTRSWYHRTLDINVTFGEYRPDSTEASWGLDMFTVGPHESERSVQQTGDGRWPSPVWADQKKQPELISTDRAILMDGDRPILPGSSVRGPLRHGFSRLARQAGLHVMDPHAVQGDVGVEDPGGQVFGTVNHSSRILIRDARAEADWAAARLHMHAEDEFSAGSYGSAKRDAVRVIQGVFPVRIVVEGENTAEVEALMKHIDCQVAYGTLGHLPVGGDKTRGAGWGRWIIRQQPDGKNWTNDDVRKMRTWTVPKASEAGAGSQNPSRHKRSQIDLPENTHCRIRTTHGSFDSRPLILGNAAKHAAAALEAHKLVAWWCEPAIDLALTSPPPTFGLTWPNEETLRVDEVAFFAEHAVWRAARTPDGEFWVFIEEVFAAEFESSPVNVVHTPARLHGFKRFSAAETGQGHVLLREWHDKDEIIGFTIAESTADAR